MSKATRALWCQLVDLSDAWHELSKCDDESENEMAEMAEMAEEECGVSALEPQIADLSIS